MSPKRTIIYRDPLHDDFAGTDIHHIEVDETFPFRHGPLWNGAAFLLYYLVGIPIVWLVAKVYLGLKFENRKVLRKVRKTGCYLYGNHTQGLDAFLPPLSAWPKRAYVIAGADAVSLPCLKNIVQMFGAIPIPTKPSGMRSFLKRLAALAKKKQIVAVFPEAHIWPYYTDIRPFTDTSFRYPVKTGLPAVAMVVTYRKRRGLFRFMRRPAVTVTFSEPFFCRTDLSPKEAQKALRDEVYDFMKAVSRTRENVEYYRYVRETDTSA